MVVVEEEEEGVCCWKKGASWEAAMESVIEVLRARIRSWKGRRGGWVFVVRVRRGFIILVRSGGKYGRVRVWYSRRRRERRFR